jgi:pimeloyl-ACP methyl ester carboxylesterase
LGGLLAATIAMARPEQVGRMVFLDIVGPSVNFIEKRMDYFHYDVETYLSYDPKQRFLFPDQESAIKERMKIGNISHQAAKALVSRGTIQTEAGWHWTYDKRLRCVGSTLPLEDELRQMLSAIKAPVCLIRALQGIPYPDELYQSRKQYFNELTIHEIPGGHHVHMDNPKLVAGIIAGYLGGGIN